MTNQTVLIADLHLDPAQPDTIRLFEQFFDSTLAKQAKALYILGDLFEAWIGDDDKNDFTQRIERLLKQFTDKGKKLYLMHGNRDFLIGKPFAKRVGGDLINDPTVLNIEGKTILLTHGDTLCTDDRTHQRYRRLTQHHITKSVLRTLPLAFRRQLAIKLRQQSRHHFRQNNSMMQDVNPIAVQKMLDHHKADVIIHGHTHLPGNHHDSQGRVRHVLGAWHHSGYAFTLETSKVTTWTLQSGPDD